MGIPSSQVCAAWVKLELGETDWVLLSDVCVRAIGAYIPGWTAGQVYDYVEQNVSYVAEHLRDEAAECSMDGKAPTFEVDNEQNPYIRSRPNPARSLLVKLRLIDPFELERVCANVLKNLGANAHTTQQTNDGGIDFVAVGLRIVAGSLGVPDACKAAVIGQAKRYKETNPIRESQLREFVGAAILRRHELQQNGKVGPLTPVLYAFWTTSDFDPNAKRFARASGLWYLDGDTLANYIDNLGMGSQVLALPNAVARVDNV